MSRSQIVYLSPDSNHEIPETLDYPHFYTPSSVAQKAAKQLQDQLKLKTAWLITESKGRMFGILVVKDKEGRLTYLSAYSGEYQAALHIIPFVPSVYQLPKGDEFKEMAGINAISAEINKIQQSSRYIRAKDNLHKIEKEAKAAILAKKQEAKKAKAARDQIRKKALDLPTIEREKLLNELAQQSTHAGMDLRRFTRAENLKLEKAQQTFDEYVEKINKLKKLRKSKSAELQDEIFKAFIFYNAQGKTKDVKMVFNDFGVEDPPAGAGECAAPKLFHYAFKNNLTPIALAEFWWGPSPNSEIREHGKFYPACKRKCEPILKFMLEGIAVEPNPLLKNYGANKQLELLYTDEYLVVINKPEGLLSVPGKTILDSVQTRIQKSYLYATGPLIVHRLDQDTSGIMIVTLKKEVHKTLQQQFLERSIQKTYVALLDGEVSEQCGKIDLPLILDINHRPMQKVDFKYGKNAVTEFNVIDKNAKHTLIELKPITGRSHQLRVHCAHKLGLHAPIVGDNLYGNRTERLHLHAQKIRFTHPVTQEELLFETKTPFDLRKL